jgi:hypothetical protein
MWSTALKKKLASIRTDLNHKIDRLEVDKNQLMNKTQRKIAPVYMLNAVEYSLERERALRDIERGACEDYEEHMRTLGKYLNEYVDERTSEMFAKGRTLSKEMQLVSKSLESVVFILNKVNASCEKVNADMDELERAYDFYLQNSKKQETDRCLDDDDDDQDIGNCLEILKHKYGQLLIVVLFLELTGKSIGKLKLAI